VFLELLSKKIKMEINMNFLKKIALLSLFCSSVALAQSASQAEVEKSMESLSAAILAADQKALDNITMSDIMYAHSDGRIQDKKEFIDALVTGKSAFTKIQLSDQKITFIGDLAFVSNHMSADIAPSGKPAHVELNIFYVWKKEGNSWKLLARKAFKG
jgi:ketosteroid isomerase-like protein